MPADLSKAQQLLLHRKIHVADGAYTQSSRAVRARFSSGWGAAIATAHLLGGLPDPAINWWAGQPHGHILLTQDDSTYAHQAGALCGVAGLPIEWLVGDQERMLAAVLRPLDHLLGCHGAVAGDWLSDGSGISARWQRVGEQVAALFLLGYGATEASRQNPHVYLAEGLALALLDRRRLNANDPKLERLVHSSLLSKGFWHNFLAETG